MIEKTEWYLGSSKIRTLYADHYVKGNDRLFSVKFKALDDLDDVIIVLGEDDLEGYVYVKKSTEGSYTEVKTTPSLSYNIGQVFENDEVELDIKINIPTGATFANLLPIPLYLVYRGGIDVIALGGWVFTPSEEDEKCWVDEPENEDNRCWIG